MSMDRADRVESLLLAILIQLMKGTSQAEKIRQLNLAGLSNVEIADALDTTSAVVGQTIYASKKKPTKKKSKPKKS